MSQRSTAVRGRMIRVGLTLVIVLVHLAVACAVIIKWLTSTLLGLLLLSLALYLIVPMAGPTEPYTGSELLAWFANLTDDTKVAIGTSLLTIIGFLIAFQTATKNWRDQLRAQYELAAAQKISAFFDRVLDNIIDAKLFAEQLLEAVELVATETDDEKINKIIRYHAKLSDDFLKVRSELIGSPVEANRLRDEYLAILRSHLLGLKLFDTAVEAMEDIIEHVGIPKIVDASTSEYSKAFFLRNVNVGICRTFISACDAHLDEVTSSAGTVVGMLGAPVTESNLATFTQVLQFSRSEVHELRQSIKRVMPKPK